MYFTYFQGIEPASLAIGQIEDYTLIMVGSERPGTVALYTIDNSNSDMVPRFETFIYDVQDVADTWQNLYNHKKASMIDPEDIL